MPESGGGGLSPRWRVREHKTPAFGAVTRRRAGVRCVGKSGRLSRLWGLTERLRPGEQRESARGCRKASRSGVSDTVCENVGEFVKSLGW